MIRSVQARTVPLSALALFRARISSPTLLMLAAMTYADNAREKAWNRHERLRYAEVGDSSLTSPGPDGDASAAAASATGAVEGRSVPAASSTMKRAVRANPRDGFRR